jgi:hypothetical protein
VNAFVFRDDFSLQLNHMTHAFDHRTLLLLQGIGAAVSQFSQLLNAPLVIQTRIWQELDQQS